MIGLAAIGYAAIIAFLRNSGLPFCTVDLPRSKFESVSYLEQLGNIYQPSMSIAAEITSLAVAFLSLSLEAQVWALQNDLRASAYRFK